MKMVDKHAAVATSERNVMIYERVQAHAVCGQIKESSETFEIGRVTELWRQFRLRKHPAQYLRWEWKHLSLCVHHRPPPKPPQFQMNLNRDSWFEWRLRLSCGIIEAYFFLGRMQIFVPPNLVQVSDSEFWAEKASLRHSKPTLFPTGIAFKLWFVYLFIWRGAANHK